DLSSPRYALLIHATQVISDAGAPSAGAGPATAALRRQAAPARAARGVPAVFERPQPLRLERARPLERRFGTDGARPLSDCAAELVDGHGRQRLLVYVQTNNDHGDRLLPLGATGERTGLTRGSCQAPLRSRSTVSGRRRRDRKSTRANSSH